jgi:hypothetical protein
VQPPLSDKPFCKNNDSFTTTSIWIFAGRFIFGKFVVAVMRTWSSPTLHSVGTQRI